MVDGEGANETHLAHVGGQGVFVYAANLQPRIARILL
jgi:hypothetical protein